MKKTYFTTAFIFCCLFSCSAPETQKEKKHFNATPVQPPIITQAEKATKALPLLWRAPPVKYQTLDPGLIPLAKISLNKAFESYPTGFLNDNLDAVVVLKSLSYQGVGFGGTFTHPQEGKKRKKIIYLTINEMNSGTNAAYVQEVFHHELSSILMRSHGFSKASWHNANPEGFHYQYEDNESGGFLALKKGLNQNQPLESYYQQGLLNVYASTHIEEDFNSYSEHIMTYPKKVKTLCKKHPAIKRKVAIWLDYYQSIEPRFKDTPTFQIFETKQP